MRAMMGKTFTSSSPLYPKRGNNNLQWTMLKKGERATKDPNKNSTTNKLDHDEQEEEIEILPSSASSSFDDDVSVSPCQSAGHSIPKKRSPAVVAGDAMSRLRSVLLTVITNRRRNRSGGLGSCVTGTIFGRRRGHVHLAFQVDPRSAPALLVELATPTCTLVKEMASGLVRIALECEQKKPGQDKRKGAAGMSGGTLAARLIDEPIWRAYCNGKKCGYAVRRECGPTDWKLLRAVEPVSVGAGVLPADKAEDGGASGDNEGDVMYMRAKFERVVGSRDSEAFYMLNPDGNGGPELSIYLLRV